MSHTLRLLLGHLGANGDCLYATILARQIRHDHPQAHITWAISSQCSKLLRNNSHIDSIWEIPVAGWEDQELMWRVFEREVVRRLLRHEFDHAWLSQIWPNNFQNYDGTVRPSILRSYGAEITVPIENVIALDPEEQANVVRFAEQSRLASFEHRIMFECSPKSGQSFVTPALAQEIAGFVYEQLPHATVIFLTHLPITLRHRNSRNGGLLSLRETAGLTHLCSLFVGAGAGATVAATSTAARTLPMIQLLSSSASVFGSFAHDFEYYKLPHDHIVEMTQESPRTIAAAIVQACQNGIAHVRENYGETIQARFEPYFKLVTTNLLKRNRYLDAAQSLLFTVERYGWRPELRTFAKDRIADFLPLDSGWLFPDRRHQGDEFLARLAASDSGQP